MKKDAFTLIELLAVIFILGLMVTMITIKVTKSIKKSQTLATSHQIAMIEDAALLYATNYSSELSNLNSINVDKVSLNTLISKGLILTKDLKNISLTNEVIIAKINGEVRVKYNPSNSNAIFINGLSEVSLLRNQVYTDAGAYIAIPGAEVSLLSGSSVISTVNTSVVGSYTVTYSYSNAETVVRKVNVL